MSTPYGTEVILDLHECRALPVDRLELTRYFEGLCRLIGMEREDLHFWDYEGQPDEHLAAPSHLKGTSAVQFIRTSNVTAHTLDDLRKVYVNIFSCRPFDAERAGKFTADWFGGKIAKETVLERA